MSTKLVLDAVLADKVSILAVESMHSDLFDTSVFDVAAHLRYPPQQVPPVYEYVIRGVYSQDGLLHLCYLATQHGVILMWAVQLPIMPLVSHLLWTYPDDGEEL